MFFCSVNIISWFTWVSLFNNVCFCSVSSSCLSRNTFCLFSVSWHERVLFFLSLSRTMCECMCVSRAINGECCLHCLFTFFFTFLHCVLFTVHASPVLVGLGFFLCLRDVAVVSLVGLVVVVVIVTVINAGLNCMLFCFLHSCFLMFSFWLKFNLKLYI